MEQIRKRIIYTVVMAICLFSLSACSIVNSDSGSGLSESKEFSLIYNSELTVESLISNSVDSNGTVFENKSDDDLRAEAAQLREEGYGSYDEIADGLENFTTLNDRMGDFKGIAEGSRVSKLEDGYLVSMVLLGSKANINCSLSYDKKLQPVGLSFTANYSMTEKFESAAANLLTGMIVVFVVLAFISWIISLFKYINIWEQKRQKAKDNDIQKEETSIQIQDNVSSSDTDSELIAVITAAIAANEGTGTDGLVVRSIKRVTNSKWKRG